jgi:methylated-DNA-[protein]-cysteine S-methyltransferase
MPKHNRDMDVIFRSFFPTLIGCGAVAATERGLAEVFLPFGSAGRVDVERMVAGRYPEAVAENDLTARAAALLEGYFRGERTEFPLPLDLPAMTEFRRRVYEVVVAIPYGAVMTYAEVAALAGSPRGARAVGGAMAANPVPVVVPCHRVMGAGGCLTGFSATGGVDAKKWLLDLESGGNCSG